MSIRNHAGVVAILLSSVTAHTATATASDWQCPPQISATPLVSSQQPGLQVLLSSGQRSLDRVGIFLGPLNALAAQVPDQSENKEGMAIDSWQLPRTAGDHYLVGCSYTDTSAMLYKALPDSRPAISSLPPESVSGC
ncbi:hypothetical protein WH50_13945 [Pokkaliibacter plantistimulans]|uniref:Uncharacterized protein n=1 Tax=Pokkaliibacter plantistimulans TaxID=1635171 RepID=A0ABX5LZ14_9GAMM|nr:STY0301 family protein [Pokkaliibacter plantistimulans]PXF30693.1 hypothetical protein WH50_13945 [Pokkaliibacter plantistimulans]